MTVRLGVGVVLGAAWGRWGRGGAVSAPVASEPFLLSP